MSTTSWYRRSIWNYKGIREYTKSGYEYSRTKFVEEDLDIDCSDRHYVITGCNSGIGYEIALAVAKRGGILHMVCRNEDSAKAARSDIITTTGNDKIYLHLVDLARPKALTEWAAKFAVQQEHIHVLVNNAGCLLHERRFDEDGCEIDVNFAVNTLAPYILTISLLPVLQRNEDARVINISSAGMLCVRLEPDDLMHSGMDPYDGLLVYSQNKRQQVVMSLWFAQRYDKVHFSCMHPGWVDTPAVRNSQPQFYEEVLHPPGKPVAIPRSAAPVYVPVAVQGNLGHPANHSPRYPQPPGQMQPLFLQAVCCGFLGFISTIC